MIRQLALKPHKSNNYPHQEPLKCGFFFVPVKHGIKIIRTINSLTIKYMNCFYREKYIFYIDLIKDYLAGFLGGIGIVFMVML